MAKMNRNIRMTIVTGLKGKGIDEAVKDTKRLGKQLNSLSINLFNNFSFRNCKVYLFVFNIAN